MATARTIHKSEEMGQPLDTREHLPRGSSETGPEGNVGDKDEAAGAADASRGLRLGARSLKRE